MAHDPRALAAARRDHFDPARMIGAFEGGRIVGTVRTFAADLTLPGGARVPVSCVTAVSTLPTHRRRGVLTRLYAFFLGGTLADACRSTATVVHRPGALVEADGLLKSADAPWC